MYCILFECSFGAYIILHDQGKFARTQIQPQRLTYGEMQHDAILSGNGFRNIRNKRKKLKLYLELKCPGRSSTNGRIAHYVISMTFQFVIIFLLHFSYITLHILRLDDTNRPTNYIPCEFMLSSSCFQVSYRAICCTGDSFARRDASKL